MNQDLTSSGFDEILVDSLRIFKIYYISPLRTLDSDEIDDQVLTWSRFRGWCDGNRT